MENNSIKKKRRFLAMWISIAIVIVLSYPLSQMISTQIAFKCVNLTKEYCDTHFFINTGLVYVMKYSNKNDIPILQDLKQVAPSRGYVVYSGAELTKNMSPTGAIWFFKTNGSLYARCDYNDYRSSFSDIEEYNYGSDFLSEKALMKSNHWYMAIQK